MNLHLIHVVFLSPELDFLFHLQFHTSMRLFICTEKKAKSQNRKKNET